MALSLATTTSRLQVERLTEGPLLLPWGGKFTVGARNSEHTATHQQMGNALAN